jgi:hypothetical protein
MNDNPFQVEEYTRYRVIDAFGATVDDDYDTQEAAEDYALRLFHEMLEWSPEEPTS